MWFVFPQVEGLGSSPMAQRYAIGSLAEAGAYLKHPVLGERLRECVGLVLAAERPITEIFGYPDHLKFKSSITLFSAAAPKERVFADALEKLCGGKPDRATLEKIGGVKDSATASKTAASRAQKKGPRGSMTKTNETKFPAGGRERGQDVHVAAKHGPKHPVGSKSKKERPASKGRVHKGRTRN
jgi:uncharacterized protein (DUF1810 family)